MINCLIICITIIFCFVYGLHWMKHMSSSGLPHFIIGHLEPAPDTEPTVSETSVIGFTAPEEDAVTELNDVEKREKILSDMASTYTAIMRGEFDLDEFGR